MTQQKVTYTTIGSNEEFHVEFDKAVEKVRQDFGKLYPNKIGGKETEDRKTVQIKSPIDRRIVMGSHQLGTKDDATHAVEIAHNAFKSWRDLGWEKRVQIMRKAADKMSENKYYLAAFMAYEAGKNRLESMGEVEESVDLIRYYASILEENRGFVKPMQRLSEKETTMSVLVPYGVWGVIAPFNFPLALSTGMVAGALVTGNTVVFKPSHDAPLIGHFMVRMFHEGGIPGDVLHYLAGSGSEVGATIVDNPLTQGMVFTGSYEVGMHIYKSFAKQYPKPVIAEMGGKNPCIVTSTADIDAAVDGILRSAFGYGGQKCSACSRVYVEDKVKDEFVKKFVEKSKGIVIGNPINREVFLGPVINESAVKNYENYVSRLKESGAQILLGGNVIREGEMANGYFVQPTIAYSENKDNELFYEEMFLPIVMITAVKDVNEGVQLSNKALYGLTAGIFSRDKKEIDTFLNNIESGVTYVNRRGGATTGAWPGVNPFGGWKGSGSTGPNALGPYYLIKFLREQSRTIIQE
ncbi:MAG TPA: aldehyde dehydrogenase family protein [Acidobacteriota bacterium]|nr:aldehyde dehydrogenase family protein [Acidobacteriota bacterium]